MSRAIRKLVLLSAPVVLAACDQGAPPPQALSSEAASTPAFPSAAATLPPAPALALEGDGLRLVDPQTGSARPLAFGMDWPDALKALAFLGKPRTGQMAECGAGPLDYAKWDDGFTLYSQNGALLGWFADTQVAGKLATASGIGPGSTRAQLDGAYAAEVFESTLGTEFVAGDIGGLLDGTGKQAKITALWAGLGCSFR